MDTYSRH